MSIITTIFRDPNANPHGLTVERQAVRAIIIHAEKLLLVYSPVNKDYKFPGGGVKEGEKFEETLQREVLEECGARLTRVIREIGSIVEYAYAEELEFETFKMTSHYFRCEVDGFTMQQSLDAYEAELDFRPVWVNLVKALKTNQSRLKKPDPPRWTARDTSMLEYIKTHLM